MNPLGPVGLHPVTDLQDLPDEISTNARVSSLDHIARVPSPAEVEAPVSGGRSWQGAQRGLLDHTTEQGAS